jgi:hypothetical protein
VKRLFHAVGLQVVRLHRESFGPAFLRLGGREGAEVSAQDGRDGLRCWPEQSLADAESEASMAGSAEASMDGSASMAGADADADDDGAAASARFCVSISRPGESHQLTSAQVVQLWQAVGGSAASVKIQMCQLLCRYRACVDEATAETAGVTGASAAEGSADRAELAGTDMRLKRWLLEHWTLTGSCFDLFPGCACVYPHGPQCACTSA